jgi:hypothetical protein
LYAFAGEYEVDVSLFIYQNCFINSFQNINM